MALGHLLTIMVPHAFKEILHIAQTRHISSAEQLPEGKEGDNEWFDNPHDCSELIRVESESLRPAKKTPLPDPDRPCM